MSLDPVTMPVTPPAVPLPANVVLSADISFLWVPGQRPLTGWGGGGGGRFVSGVYVPVLCV